MNNRSTSSPTEPHPQAKAETPRSVQRFDFYDDCTDPTAIPFATGSIDTRAVNRDRSIPFIRLVLCEDGLRVAARAINFECNG